ncbi:MAG: glycosyltransferase family 4 protein, partial [Candidatus Nezhaarchaeota archaeon]|nr:glycosyltransferase family 4 protein [Candidatus Nezhaarchaeota archaeon]
MMKVAHISTLYHPLVGGLEFAVQRIAEEQARLGHEVLVVTSDASGVRTGIEVMNGVTVIRVKSVRARYPYFIIPREAPEAMLKGVDVVQGWSHTYYFVYKLSRYSKAVLKKPLAIYFIGVDYLRRHFNPIIRLLGYQYQKTITRRLVGLVDLAIVTNDHEKDVLRERYGLKSVVLPHGVSEQYLNMPSMEKSFRNKYGVDERIIAFIGRIHPTKGLNLLIRAFAEVAKKELDVILVIAGKGEADYLRKCMKLTKGLSLKNRVKYLGYISEEDKIGLIDSSEFVVIPSRHAGESYPLIIDEVKARGKPLVVTNCGALPHRVINLVEGVVVNADVHSLTKGIHYALSNVHSFHVQSRPFTWREVSN